MGTVGKALELLTIFSRTRPQIGLSDLARSAGLNKATCFRLMAELQAQGFVEQVGAAREYRLGPAVLGLAALREATVPTRESALPALQRLADTTGETAHISHRVGDRLQTLAFAYGGIHGTKVMMEDADWLPWHATSSGLAVLAFLPLADQDAILSQPLLRLTARTETDPGAVRRLMAQVRARGAAESTGTFEADVQSYALPLFGPDGGCRGAIAVAAPAARMTSQLRGRIIRDINDAARVVTEVWGGVIPSEIDALWQKAA
jgi:IclR family transcriptional regulator, acetate operon repressor